MNHSSGKSSLKTEIVNKSATLERNKKSCVKWEQKWDQNNKLISNIDVKAPAVSTGLTPGIIYNFLWLQLTKNPPIY